MLPDLLRGSNIFIFTSGFKQQHNIKPEVISDKAKMLTFVILQYFSVGFNGGDMTYFAYFHRAVYFCGSPMDCSSQKLSSVMLQP